MLFRSVTETNFDHLWQLVLITNLTTLLPLPLLFLLPSASAQGTTVTAAEETPLTPSGLNLDPVAITVSTLESDC